MAHTFVKSDGTLIGVKDGGCYKHGYPHRRDAVKVAKRASKTLFVYRCRRCGHHHLTAQANRDGTGRGF